METRKSVMDMYGKLIGIISHVFELKQSIDEQLAVTENEYGSSAKWITETGI